MPPPSANPRPSTSGGLVRRLAAAQDIGLVIVIALMMLGLTLATPSITTTEFFPQPAGATAAAADGVITVTAPDSRPATYREADGWSFRPTDEGVILVRQREVNKFLNKQNLDLVARTASYIAVMAVGMTGIIIMGGIDLSVGSIYALAAVIGAMALNWLERVMPGAPGYLSIPLGVGACVGIGAASGLINGASTVGLRVHPFIITLGGMAVYRGIAFVTSEGQSITGFPESFTSGGFKAEAFGVNPVPSLVMIAVTLVGAYIARSTVFGRQTYAIGGNETAARYAGVPVGRIKVALFTATGAMAGLSAAMMCGYLGAASSDAGNAYELRVIAASVVGGASLSGGRGSVVGAMLGALIMQLIENGIIVLGIDTSYTNIVIGLAIVLAVVVDQLKARLAPGRR